MNTYRHNYDLRFRDSIIIAPRYFSNNDYTYFVHIHKNCRNVDIWILRNYIDCGHINVSYHSSLKLYSNTKGLYFNFSYWIDNYKKTKTRVYICD